jgi:hypothetical protein
LPAVTTSADAPFTKRLPNALPEAENNWALYDEFLELCEEHRWKMVDVRREIASVDPAALTDNDRKVLDCVGEVAVVEGNAPSIVANQLALMLYDAEFAAWATYQVGEEAKHFHVMRHYCRHVGHPVAVEHSEAKLAERQKGFDPGDFQDEYAVILINVFGETLNIHLYQQLSAVADEPVLKELLMRIARDERRHLLWFLAYFRKRGAEDPAWIDRAHASLARLLRVDEAPTGEAQHHQGTGAPNYLAATDKVIRYGFSTPIIARVVVEQWRLLKQCFGARLAIDRRQFFQRQMARPETIASLARAE